MSSQPCSAAPSPGSFSAQGVDRSRSLLPGTPAPLATMPRPGRTCALAAGGCSPHTAEEAHGFLEPVPSPAFPFSLLSLCLSPCCTQAGGREGHPVGPQVGGGQWAGWVWLSRGLWTRQRAERGNSGRHRFSGKVVGSTGIPDGGTIALLLGLGWGLLDRVLGR